MEGSGGSGKRVAGKVFAREIGENERCCKRGGGKNIEKGYTSRRERNSG